MQRLRDEGVDFIKIGSGVTPECFAAIVESSREAGLPVAGHVPSGMSALEVATAGQRSIEHLTGMPGDCFRDGGPGPSCTAEIASLAATGVRVVPTLVAWRGRLLGMDADAHDDLRYVDDLSARWTAESTLSDAAIEDNRRLFAQFLAAVGALHDAGAVVLAGTDCANAWVVPGFALHDELKLLVDAGLTPAEALAAAAASPSRFLGLEHEVGTVTPGKRADLVLLDADPLANIANTSRIVAVIIGGEVFQRAELDSLLSLADGAAERTRP